MADIQRLRARAIQLGFKANTAQGLTAEEKRELERIRKQLAKMKG